MTIHRSTMIGGTLTQASLPKRIKTDQPGRANGLLLRGCVVATYVTDDPAIDADSSPYFGEAPRYVYCDVLCYSNLPGQRFIFIQNALVAQHRGGMHNGRVWKPRAATIDITGGELVGGGQNPMNLDGDHVVVGFLDDLLSQPIILYGIPHPVQDTGGDTKPKGNRLNLKVADGDPDFLKHHGSYFGIDDNGDFIADTTFANDGTVDGTGIEPDPPTDGKGSQRFRLAQDSEHEIVLLDMADPTAPVEVARIVTTKDAWEISFQQGATLKVELKDADAKLTLGDGAVKAAIADHLKAMWEDFVNTKFPAHTHIDGFGGTGPVNSGPVTPWDPTIESTKLTFPDG